MRDQRRPMVGQERPISFKELEQTWHLLEVGGHIGVVAPEMDIVELNVDDVLDAVAEVALRQCRLAKRGGEQPGGREKTHWSHLRDPPQSVLLISPDISAGRRDPTRRL